MRTNWHSVRSVLFEESSTLTQTFAEGHPEATTVGSTAGQSSRWVYIPICDNNLSLLRIGYQYLRWPTDCRSRVTRVALFEMPSPGARPVEIVGEDVCLNSESYRFATFPSLPAPDPCRDLEGLATCADGAVDNAASVTSHLPRFYSAVGFLLGLRVEFSDHRDRFVVGPVGVEDHRSDLLVASPCDFGAAGDGETDDFRALTRTVDFALANGLPVDLGGRSYAISRPLLISPDPNHEGTVVLRNGEVRSLETRGAALRVDKGGDFVAVHFADLTVVGAAEIGVDLARAAQSTLERVRIEGGFGVGLQLRGCMLNHFSDCQFLDNDVNVQIDAYEGDFRSNDNKFWSCQFLGAQGAASLRMLIGVNNAFYACDFENSAQHGIWVDGGHGTSFLDCRFEAAFVDDSQPHPWSLVRLDVGRNTRIANCLVPGTPTPELGDAIVIVSSEHVGVKITESVFSGIQNLLEDPGGNVESYGNWGLPST